MTKAMVNDKLCNNNQVNSLGEVGMVARLTCGGQIGGKIHSSGNLHKSIGVAKGDKGDKGDTPVKGVDYFTKEDIESLKIPQQIQDGIQPTKELVEKINSELDSLGLTVDRLQVNDENLNETLQKILKKMDSLVRYSKGTIHKISIY